MGAGLTPLMSFLPQTSSWVNLVLWSAVLLLQVAQCKYRPLPYQSLDTGSPGCSSEADALLRPH